MEERSASGLRQTSTLQNRRNTSSDDLHVQLEMVLGRSSTTGRAATCDKRLYWLLVKIKMHGNCYKLYYIQDFFRKIRYNNIGCLTKSITKRLV